MKNVLKIAIVPCCLAGLYQDGVSAFEKTNTFSERSNSQHKVRLQNNHHNHHNLAVVKEVASAPRASRLLSFKDKQLESFWVYEDHNVYPGLKNNLLQMLTALDQADAQNPFKNLVPGSSPELLKGDRKGQTSLRINGKYRLCFQLTPLGAKGLEVVDYHRH